MVVQMSNLGKNGRFGNQIFQHFFLKLAAMELGCEISTPQWIGNSIFNIPKTIPLEESINFFPLERIATRYDSPDSHLEKIKKIIDANNFNRIDVSGYFQYHTKYLKKYQEKFKDIFDIDDSIIRKANESLKKLKEDSQPLIALHYRAGDYLEHEKSNHPIFVPPNIDSISQKIDDIYSQIRDRNPIVYLASDDLPYASALLSSKGISHITSLDFGVDKNEDGLLALDFTLLTLADILLISNSSFSFAAAMLSKKGKYFFRPRIEDKKYVAFDPWDDYVLRQKVSTLYI
jgi:hypothetical protein